MNYDVYINEYCFKKLIFSGGEVHIEFNDRTTSILNSYKNTDLNPKVLVNIPLRSTDDFMCLYFINEHLKTLGFTVSVQIHYFPYARQDRQTADNNLHTLKYFSKLINSCNFDKIYIYDPHSIAVENLINNSIIIKQKDILIALNNNLIYTNNKKTSIDTYASDLNYFQQNKYCFVAPDLGAVKKTEESALAFGVPFVTANKKRNPQNGNIEGIYLLSEIPSGIENLLVIDDICDGGRTFIELSKILPNNINKELFVTHGIFSKGLDCLTEAGYTKIFTTDSICTQFGSNKNLQLIRLNTNPTHLL